MSEKNFDFDLGKVTKFCSHGYRSLKENDKTFYKNIYSLDPGKNLILNENLDYNFKKYWNVKLRNKIDNEKKSIRKIKNMFFDNLKRKFRSDVPLAFCLSGGIDSNTLAYS